MGEDEQLVEAIARVCHEANRGYQAAFPSDGIPVAVSWDEFPEDQRAGVREGVSLALYHGATPEELHENWCRTKLDAGWRYGDVKDADAKTHPCLVAYADLSEDQRRKDALFAAIVGALGY